MTKKTAETLQWIGCILIVSAMLVSRLLIAIPEPVMLAMPEFKALWGKINSKSVYVVDFDTDELVRNSIDALDRNRCIYGSNHQRPPWGECDEGKKASVQSYRI